MEFGFGSGILTGVRNDSGAGASPTPRRFGALQDVSVEFTGDIKELFSTQQFPIDVARGKTKITGKAKLAEIKSGEYNDLFFGQTLATGSLKYAYNESVSAGTSAFSYTVANSGSTPLTDQGAFYVSNGNQLDQVTGAPGSGQYTWNPSTGVYGFATADAGSGFFVNYLYHVTAGHNIAIGNPFMGTTPQFQATLFQQFEGNQIVLVLNKCVSSRLTFPTRIDDYMIEELDFSAFADTAGNVGSWNSTN
jgi:hypothetical protein